MTALTSRSLNRLSIVSTLVDAALSFRNGRPGTGLALLGAAALSSRVHGIGAAASVVLRLVRRIR